MMIANLERLSAALADRYRIERELGQGGMATVYLAFDLKHDRRVALKVLKPELAAVLGAERFVVEIKTTAALQHPHILPLFDSGTADGFLYYVMPFIDGETLRDKLNRETQLGIDEAVKIAMSIADALDYAHRKGVIHRDIKPENILLHDGRPMVADFGIALAVSAAAGGRMTETGLSLGTPHYMSPEQATAEKEISGRSDVYSLASVLYEMLAGQPPHMGGSAQQIIMKIIAEPVEPVTRYRKTVPPNVSAALAKALEKLPADRFASAKAFGDALATPGFAHAAVGTRASAAGAARDWRAKAAIPALVLAAALLMVVAWGATRPVAPLPVSRYEVAWAGASGGDFFSSLAVSPDGTRLVMVRRDGGASHLVVRRRDQLEVTDIPGTDNAINPAFSPKGDRVVFMSGPTIRMVDLAGGLPTLVTDSLVGVPGLAWGHDGYIYFDRSGAGPLMRIRETGGVAEAISTIDAASNELQHVWPDPLPNGRGVIMVINRGGPGQGAYETDGIAVLDLKTGKHRELFRGVYARYATSGYLLYVTREGELFGVPFDQDRLEVTGPAVSLAQGISVNSGGSGSVDLSIARDGTLWYSTGGQRASRREIVWASRDGKVTPVEPEIKGDILDVALSPDGLRLALILRDQEGAHAYVTRLGSSNRDRLTFDQSFQDVTWHPDGRQLLLNSTYGELFAVPSDGSGRVTPIRTPFRNILEARWLPDGTSILFAVQAPGRANVDIFARGTGTDSTAKPILAEPGSDRGMSVSPNGRWLLNQSLRSDIGKVFVRPFPNTATSLHQVSSGTGRQPRWSPDGKEIFYRTFTDTLMAVPVNPGEGLSLGAEHPVLSLRGVSTWDVAPDGKGFLLVRDREAASGKRLIVVENFDEELKARVPR